MIQEKVVSDSVKIITETDPTITQTITDFVSKNEIIVLPFILLLIIYSLKYFFGNNFNKKSLLDFLLEFPVDFGFIGITFVFTYSFLDLQTVVFGKVMILVCILLAIVNSTIRRFAIKEYDKESCNNIALGFYGIINTSISIIFVFFILSAINNGQ